MKQRITALILTLCMLASLLVVMSIPAMAATDITVSYADLPTDILGQANANSQQGILFYETTPGTATAGSGLDNPQSNYTNSFAPLEVWKVAARASLNMKASEWVRYEVDVAEAGYYSVGITYGCGALAGADFIIRTDSNIVETHLVKSGANAYSWKSVADLGYLYLNAGSNYIYVDNKSASAVVNFKELTLTKNASADATMVTMVRPVASANEIADFTVDYADGYNKIDVAGATVTFPVSIPFDGNYRVSLFGIALQENIVSAELGGAIYSMAVDNNNYNSVPVMTFSLTQGEYSLTLSGMSYYKLVWVEIEYVGIFENILNYSISDAGITILDCSSSISEKFEIPCLIEGYPVTAIGNYAFSGCDSLTDVTIPNGVTAIGDYAFSGCDSLLDVNIPNSVTTIGSGAFSECISLTAIDIPNGVTTIGDYAFSGCDSLLDVNISNGVTTIGRGAFSECISLTAIDIPSGVTAIGDYAFSGCDSLLDVNISNGVTTIGSGAFSECISLTAIDIPNGVTTIGDYAFSGCDSLTDVVISDSVTIIEEYAFAKCTGLTSVILGKSIVSIGDYAFLNCSNLTSVSYYGTEEDWGSITIGTENTSLTDATIYFLCYEGACGENVIWYLNPNGVLTISGVGAMVSVPWSNYRDSIKSVVIEDGVTSICDSAFFECINLTDVTIPNSVTTIGTDAFSECISLTVIDIPNGVTAIGASAFYNTLYYNTSSNWENGVLYIENYLIKAQTSLNGSYQVKEDTIGIASSAFSDCNSLTSIVIPDNVVIIGEFVFYSCDNLTEVIIGNGVNDISDYAFSGCNTLADLTIGNNVKSIGNYAFCGCDSLTDVTIPNSVTVIGDYAFSGCDGLMEIIIPNSVTAIGGYAFRNCDNLTDVTIPDSVVDISDAAFCECRNLINIAVDENNAYYSSIDGNLFNKEQTVLIQYAIGKPDTSYTIPDGVTIIKDASFSYGDSLTDVVISDSVTIIEEYAFAKCTGLTSVILGKSIVSIGDYAYSGCNGLVDVTVPDSVTTIGSGAFSECISLTAIDIPSGVTAIGDYAFSGCDSLLDVNISNGVTAIGSGAFSECISLTAIDIPSDVTAIGDYAFSGCDSLLDVNISNGVTTIGSGAFSECVSLTAIDIPNGVTTIGDYALSGCDSLTDVVISDSVTIIEEYAFAKCTGLTSVILGKSIVSIGDYAFLNCSNLTSVSYHGTEEDWRSITIGVRNTFLTNATRYFLCYEGVCGENVNWYLDHNGVLTISGVGAMVSVPWSNYRDFIKSVVIEDGVTSIYDGAFRECYNLTNIAIGNNITSIGNYAFCGCDSLSDVTIPDSVITIGDVAFADCDNLIEVALGNNVTSIGNYAFCDSGRLTNVSIGDSVDNVGQFVFSGCNSLTCITVDENNAYYSSVDGNLFNKEQTVLIQYAIGKTNMSYIIPDSVTTIGDYAFSGCDSLTNITIGHSVITIGDYAFSDCGGLTDVTFGDSVTTIGAGAFHSCCFLTSVTMPDSIVSIGDSAYYNDYCLSDVTIGNNVTSIGESAFLYCDSLTDVYYNGTEEEWDQIIIGIENTPLTDAIMHYLDLHSYVQAEKITLDEKEQVHVAVSGDFEEKQLILVCYQGDVLSYVEMTEIVAGQDDYYFLPDGEYTSAKVMVWNSLSDLSPIIAATPIE